MGVCEAVTHFLVLRIQECHRGCLSSGDMYSTQRAVRQLGEASQGVNDIIDLLPVVGILLLRKIEEESLIYFIDCRTLTFFSYNRYSYTENATCATDLGPNTPGRLGKSTDFYVVVVERVCPLGTHFV